MLSGTIRTMLSTDEGGASHQDTGMSELTVLGFFEAESGICQLQIRSV